MTEPPDKIAITRVLVADILQRLEKVNEQIKHVHEDLSFLNNECKEYQRLVETRRNLEVKIFATKNAIL